MEEERIINIERWDYELSLNGDRVKILREAPPFEEITEEIKREMEILCFHSDECTDNNPFARAVYCIQVEENLFDWFFNSENGYRAAYFRSPCDGLKANEYFIQSLMPKLLKSGKTTPNPGKNFIEESLKSPSAKVWLVEEKHMPDPQKKPCRNCSGEWNPDNKYLKIYNDRWEQEEGHGSKAPYLTKIRIIGAFLNDHYDEFIPSSKRFRAKEINENGWS